VVAVLDLLLATMFHRCLPAEIVSLVAAAVTVEVEVATYQSFRPYLRLSRPLMVTAAVMVVPVVEVMVAPDLGETTGQS
jgi:hypothetical protein